MSQICTKCKENKSLDDFYANKSRRLGVRSECKACHNGYKYIYNNVHKERKKQYDIEHRHEIKQYSSAYYEKHKDQIHSYKLNRRKTDVQFKLAHDLRARVRHAIKTGCKAGSAIRDLGCSIKELKNYLQSKFQPGMCWDNWSLKGWHVDHIKPLSSFNLSDREEFLKACHYTNLQPLWAEDNIRKSNR